jgi:hypothetical protein
VPLRRHVALDLARLSFAICHEPAIQCSVLLKVVGGEDGFTSTSVIAANERNCNEKGTPVLLLLGCYYRIVIVIATSSITGSEKREGVEKREGGV